MFLKSVSCLRALNLNLSNADLSKEVEHLKPQASLETLRKPEEKREDQEKKVKPPEVEPIARESVAPADPEGEVPAREVAKVTEEGAADDVEPGPTPNKTPRPRKHYSFTEATENLHHGLPTSCGQASGSPRCRHSMGKHRSDQDDQDLRLEPASYEPSFGKAARVKAKETAFRNKKSSLMEELFGAGFAGRSGPTNGEVAGKAQQLGPSQASASNAFGDSRATVVRSIQPSPTEGNRKTVT